MTQSNKIPNRLIDEQSPYLLQHAYNPVDWFPWGEEAFTKAKQEDKPIFLSIGYSTCHWCHVMEEESFEDVETAQILNEYFVSIKVDREERPDIDSIYMSVCQALTGSGGWPMSVFITPGQKPFFAGTYFSNHVFKMLLKQINTAWNEKRKELIASGEEIQHLLNNVSDEKGEISQTLIDDTFKQFEKAFDKEYGGFGREPKFPSPHNLIFLMDYYVLSGEQSALDMAEYTLMQMYKGGIFDHIGFGFSRYSTDRYYLAPHFEKMLYDNALLMMSYVKAYDVTHKIIYKEIAEKIAAYILREMTEEEGGFFSAQDADSEGEEGKYYVFDYDEITDLLGSEIGKRFNEYYGITKEGNFEGKNIPNLLHNTNFSGEFDEYLGKIYKHRKSRTKLHLDDKILTSWNGLMIAAFSMLYRITDNEEYLHVAQKACDFIEKNLSDNDILYVSYRDGKHGSPGFLDDYAFYIYGLINLYEATFKQKYLDRATALCKKTICGFFDSESGGFYLYGSNNEQLIIKPKETYDGAIPSGNSVMTYNMILLSQITQEDAFSSEIEKQLKFMAAKTQDYPMGQCFYLLALSIYMEPPVHIVCVLKDNYSKFPLSSVVRVIDEDNRKYPIINNQTTYYVCRDKNCLPPVNNLEDIL